jgi:hypothetical protein
LAQTRLGPGLDNRDTSDIIISGVRAPFVAPHDSQWALPGTEPVNAGPRLVSLFLARASFLVRPSHHAGAARFVVRRARPMPLRGGFAVP